MTTGEARTLPPTDAEARAYQLGYAAGWSAKDKVASADLDRLRAVEQAALDVDDGWHVVDPGREQVRLRYASDLPRRLNTLRAALGDRAAEEGR